MTQNNYFDNIPLNDKDRYTTDIDSCVIINDVLIRHVLQLGRSTLSFFRFATILIKVIGSIAIKILSVVACPIVEGSRAKGSLGAQRIIRNQKLE